MAGDVVQIGEVLPPEGKVTPRAEPKEPKELKGRPRGSVLVTISVAKPVSAEHGDVTDVDTTDLKIIDQVVAFCVKNRIRYVAPPIQDGEV